jgi:hypothetical protein
VNISKVQTVEILLNQIGYLTMRHHGLRTSRQQGGRAVFNSWIAETLCREPCAPLLL